MRKIVCDVCNKEVNACDVYDEDGYSKFVTVQTLDNRIYGNEEYEVCNDCFVKIIHYVTRLKGEMADEPDDGRRT